MIKCQRCGYGCREGDNANDLEGIRDFDTGTQIIKVCVACKEDLEYEANAQNIA